MTSKVAQTENFFNFGELKIRELTALNPDSTIFLLPVSSLEAHGYHLPHNADQSFSIIMAEVAAHAFAKKYPEWNVVLFPLLSVGSATIPYPGSVNMPKEVVYQAVYHTAKSIHQYGFKNLVITTGHGGLSHNMAIDDACRSAIKKLGMNMFSPGVLFMEDYIFGKSFSKIETELGRDLTIEEKKGLTHMEHGAAWETSIALADYPHLVDKNYKTIPTLESKPGRIIKFFSPILEGISNRIPPLRRYLADHDFTIKKLLLILKSTNSLYSQKKEDWTYVGDPASGSSEIGEAWKKSFAKDMVNCMEDVVLQQTKSPNDFLSPYTRFFFMRRPFFTSLKWSGIMAVLLFAYLS